MYIELETYMYIHRDIHVHVHIDIIHMCMYTQVLPADVLTRVSGYVEEVIAYVQRIIDNGFA